MSHYFRRMNNDSWIMKTVVGIVGFINAIDTLATISAVYLVSGLFFLWENLLDTQPSTQ
jgi:hypothetical protein